jgi:aryl-alcohol dehydrogenase-like predicted oxidoreductase
MGVIPWSPLAGGWLSGAFGAGKQNTSRRSARLPARYDTARESEEARGRR